MFRKTTRSSALLFRSYSSNHEPYRRTWNLMSNEVKTLIGSKTASFIYPEHADIVIIGGGFIGSAIAYWLKTRAGEGLSVVVLEKDTSYSKSQSTIGLGVLSQHYSLPENIELSQYTAEFLRNSQQYLGASVDINYNPKGQLHLASEKYASILEENVNNLKEMGIRNELLSINELKSRFPWINTEDIYLGCMGSESEGTFNAWEMLKGFLIKSQELGTIYVNAEALEFEFEAQKDMLMEGVAPGQFKKLTKVKYKTAENNEYAVKFSSCVIATGDNAQVVAEKVNIGKGNGLLSVPLPIEKKYYNIYSMENGGKTTGLNTPYLVDTSGLWLHRNGIEDNILFGHLPLELEETKELSEEEYYKVVIEPSLFNRFPESRNLKISRLQEEFIDHNRYDSSGIIGPHPYHTNLYIAAGFGKDGCQHACGIGRGITELIIDGKYKTVDLTRFTFDRFLTVMPITETNIY